MDFNDYNVKIIPPIVPTMPTKNNTRQNRDDRRQRSRLKSNMYLNEQEKDTFIPSDNSYTLYNNKGQLYASTIKKNAAMNKVIVLEDQRTNISDSPILLKKDERNLINAPEYARTFLPLDKLPEDNRFKSLFYNDINCELSHPNHDVSTTLLTPMYCSYDSYSSFVNRDPRNSMFRELTEEKPRLICRTMKELQDKYFNAPEYIDFKDAKI